ncbi:hypothetical protein [Demequina salsinemoris]|uniref:hypothetical protein n=1 Tax=Demequina salsinemoris TaxID=577470 RepID=UPI0007857CF7|nr:hypothetical protein [Demequina salsinemoris]
MSARERVSTTIGGLQTAGGDILPWRWYAEKVLEHIEADDLVVYWYTGHGMRGVAPYEPGHDFVEVFYSDPDVRHAFRSDDPSSVPIHGRRESRPAGIHEIAEALAKGETMHVVPLWTISQLVGG